MDNKLNKKLIIEKPLKEDDKKKSPILILLIIIIFILIVFIILEKLNYINYLDFI